MFPDDFYDDPRNETDIDSDSFGSHSDIEENNEVRYTHINTSPP